METVKRIKTSELQTTLKELVKEMDETTIISVEFEKEGVDGTE